MINEIPVRVSFANNTLTKKSTVVVEGDYNTTKLVFEFEEDVTNKQVKFGMTNPQGELVMYCGLINNEIILSTEDIDGKISSVFSTDGLYTFRVFLVGENGESQLTSAPGYLPVDQSQVQTGMKAYGPFIDNLMRQVDNLDIAVVEEQGKLAIKITHKDGSTEICELDIAPETLSEITDGNLDPVNSVAVINYINSLGVSRKTTYVFNTKELNEKGFHGEPLVQHSTYVSPNHENGGYSLQFQSYMTIACLVEGTQEIQHIVESPVPQDAIYYNSSSNYLAVDPSKFSFSRKGYELKNPDYYSEDMGDWLYLEDTLNSMVDGESILSISIHGVIPAASSFLDASNTRVHTLSLQISGQILTSSKDVAEYLSEEFSSMLNNSTQIKMLEEIQPPESVKNCKYIGG